MTDRVKYLSELVGKGERHLALRLHFEWVRTGILTLRQFVEFINALPPMSATAPPEKVE